jgi:hypothetical protein
MRFEIVFNKETDDKFLITQLGAKYVSAGSKTSDFELLVIDINTFEELEKLLEIVDKEKKDIYAAIISFDPPTIYLDKNI